MDEKKIFDEYGNYNFPTEKKQEGLNTIEDIKCLLVCKKWGDYFVECDENPNCIDCIAKEIRNAGYRKESDTAREILGMYRLEDTFSSFQEKVAKKYGVELE